MPETSDWALDTTHFQVDDTHTLPERVGLGGGEGEHNMVRCPLDRGDCEDGGAVGAAVPDQLA